MGQWSPCSSRWARARPIDHVDREKNFPGLSIRGAPARLWAGSADDWEAQHSQGADKMQYMLLIYEDERVFGENKNNERMQKIVEEHIAFAGSLGPTLKAGAGLKNTATATTVRTASRRLAIHDGPFAETKEQLGGYYLVDVPDLDAAIAIAKQIPLVEDGAIEIRPLLDASGGNA
jgi:hypothetical protein